jgi:N-acetylmuramic acid 6-phosphate etherase
MNEKLAQLATEQLNGAVPPLETVDTLTLVTVMNAEDQSVARAVAEVLPAVARAIDRTHAALAQGGRLFYVGAGTSGRLGFLDAAECPPTFNVEPESVQAILAGGDEAFKQAREGIEDSEQAGSEDLLSHGLTANDVVVGLAASGRTPYVMGALKTAKQVGATTISVSCNRASELASVSDVTIAMETGPEVILGSTRLKAGTAQKLVLNMLSTGTMVRLGKTYRNLMIDMHATNEKLVERARRIVMQAADCDYAQAAAGLQAADGVAKVAILMVREGISKDDAVARLERAHGHLEQALHD